MAHWFCYAELERAELWTLQTWAAPPLWHSCSGRPAVYPVYWPDWTTLPSICHMQSISVFCRHALQCCAGCSSSVDDSRINALSFLSVSAFFNFLIFFSTYQRQIVMTISKLCAKSQSHYNQASLLPRWRKVISVFTGLEIQSYHWEKVSKVSQSYSELPRITWKCRVCNVFNDWSENKSLIYKK